MIRAAPLLLFLAGACAPVAHDPALPPLAQDQVEPGPALLEHALLTFFAGPGAAADPPTVCVDLSPGGLPAEAEKALMARFPRLAPRSRCEQPPGWIDRLTGERAVLLQAYGLECADTVICTGWTNAPGSPATRWIMRWHDGRWTFAGDHRLIAQ
ncbi:hypothetical protein V5740_05345 [Croceibacterium sp. TMG7-5b_MA50]|uniref:hypothetical protein n=1 Tax=Croceibacterium sp. TMG7-5b_MA50 TaxID=3121290 RepID=UPI003221C905